MLPRTFTRPPAHYRAESEKVSIWLSAVLPFAVLVMMFTLAALFPQWTRHTIVREGFGIMEMAQFLMIVMTALIAFGLSFHHIFKGDKLLRAFIVLFALGAVYWAGEEVSWGQHFFGWLTPEGWSALNDQQETNLHNIGTWGDQKPRLILMLSIGFGGLIVPYLLLNHTDSVPLKFDFLYPPLWLRALAFLVVSTELLQHTHMPGLQAETVLLRPGEIQELFIAWFVFSYALTLRRRAGKAA